MSKRRSKKVQEPEAIEQAPTPPPKILSMLGDVFEEPNVTPPPKTVAASLSSATDTVPALPLEAVYSEEEKGDTLPSEVVPAPEHAERITVLADETAEFVPEQQVSPEPTVAAPAPTPVGRKWLPPVLIGLGVVVIAGALATFLWMSRKAQPPSVAVPSVQTEVAPLPAETASPGTPPLVNVRPRFAVPPPAGSGGAPESDPGELSALSLLDEWLSRNMSAEQPDLLMAVRKAALALFASRWSSQEVNLKALDASSQAVVEAYRKFFRELGRLDKTESSVGQLIAAGDRLAERLAEIGGLETRRVLLCRNVSGFGRYEPLTEPSVRSRHVSLLQVYVEFANPKPEIRDDGRYVYRLSQDIKIRSADKESAAPLMDTTVSLTELSLSPKKDFFSAQYLRPAQPLPPGDYVVEIMLNDQIGQTTARGKARFKVVPD